MSACLPPMHLPIENVPLSVCLSVTDHIGRQIDGCDDSVLDEIDAKKENKDNSKHFTIINANVCKKSTF